MTTKEALQRLIEELPPRELEAVQRFAEYLRLRASHPAVRAALSAPPEPATPEEADAIRAGREAVALAPQRFASRLARRRARTWQRPEQ
jgi:hypothetical protein